MATRDAIYISRLVIDYGIAFTQSPACLPVAAAVGAASALSLVLKGRSQPSVTSETDSIRGQTNAVCFSPFLE